jgi:hypothetical protein
MKIGFRGFTILIILSSFILAQDKEEKLPIKNSPNGVEAPQVVEGDVIFSDGTNQLLRITDEGTTGAIQFPSGVPSNTDFKLYRNGADLFFGTSNLTGSGTALGIDDLEDAIYDGSNSIYIGEGAGQGITGTSNYNTSVGRSALLGGSNNTAIGYYSLTSNSGLSNTAMGTYSLWKNTTGNDNVAIGHNTLYNSEEGSANIAIGSGALLNNISGQNNSSIGSFSGFNSLGDGNVFLGYQAGYSETTDNKLYIENSNSTAPLIWGDFANDSVKVNGRAHITASLSVGSGSKAVLNNSIAVGNNTEAHGLTSIAVGEENLAWGFHSSAFGLGVKAMSYVGTAIGRYNVGDPLDIFSEWNENDVLFEIGNGTDNNNRSNAVTVLKNGNVGFGPSDPTASFHVDAVNGIVFDGATTGSIPVEGSGSRMMWYQGKSAFRAGTAGPNNAWDDINIGSYSTALNYRTIASGNSSFASGYQSEASGLRSTAMGSDSKATGLHSTAIGSSVEATGDFSIAFGRYIRAAGNGTMVIGDNSVSSIAEVNDNNVFVARFDNGFRLFTSTNLTGVGVTGAQLLPGASSWSSVSDSTKKEKFQKVDGESVLNKISKFNLRSWNYKGQNPAKFRHYGPMAQEFYAAFGNDGIGNIGNDTTIASADFDGINLIAIQALEHRSKEQVSSIQNLESRIKELEEKNQELVKLNSAYKTDIEQIKNALNQVIANKNDIRMTAK